MTALSPTLPAYIEEVQAPTRSIDDVLFAVHVIDEDIQLGVRGNGRQCPIHRAAFRQLVLAGYTPERLSVGATGVGLRINGRLRRFTHSGERFVRCFDDGVHVDPCVVNITPQTWR